MVCVMWCVVCGVVCVWCGVCVRGVVCVCVVCVVGGGDVGNWLWPYRAATLAPGLLFTPHHFVWVVFVSLSRQVSTKSFASCAARVMRAVVC